MDLGEKKEMYRKKEWANSEAGRSLHQYQEQFPSFRVRAGENVLEAGCGYGNALSEMLLFASSKRAAGHVFGMDFNENCVETAAKRLVSTIKSNRYTDMAVLMFSDSKKFQAETGFFGKKGYSAELCNCPLFVSPLRDSKAGVSETIHNIEKLTGKQMVVLIHGDMEEAWNYPLNFFDKIIAIQSIAYCVNPFYAIQNILFSLKIGGKAFLDLPILFSLSQKSKNKIGAPNLVHILMSNFLRSVSSGFSVESLGSGSAFILTKEKSNEFLIKSFEDWPWGDPSIIGSFSYVVDDIARANLWVTGKKK